MRECVLTEMRDRILAEVLQLKHEHRRTWRKRPEWYWFLKLLEEVTELAGSLANIHEGPTEWELKQIASICLNWLEYRDEKDYEQ